MTSDNPPSDQNQEKINRPWLEADNLRTAVELLRRDAASVGGEPCDEWYAQQLGKILIHTDADTDSSEGSDDSGYDQVMEFEGEMISKGPNPSIKEQCESLRSLWADIHRGDGP